MSTKYTIFADESGTDAGRECYAIGALVLRDTSLEPFNCYFARSQESHGVPGEVKWQKVRRNSHGMVNFSLDLLWNVLRSNNASYWCIVVKKADYRKWRVDKEDAFYNTYSLLIRDAISRLEGDHQIVIDDRQDAYARRDEALSIITTRMLQKLGSRGQIQHLKKANSRDIPGIQAVDVLTGAVAAAHERSLKKSRGRPGGFDNTKVLTIDRMAQIIGWDDLRYDTYPNGRFNIWHFPPSWRGPDTKGVPGTFRKSAPVKLEDLRAAKGPGKN